MASCIKEDGFEPMIRLFVGVIGGAFLAFLVAVVGLRIAAWWLERAAKQ